MSAERSADAGSGPAAPDSGPLPAGPAQCPVAPSPAGGLAFSRRYRLTKTDEYSSVFGFRKAIRSSSFLLHYRPRGSDEDRVARLGVIVAKKLVRAAVRRNLIKRLAREQFRLLRPRLPARDLVLRVGSRPPHYDRRLLAAEIRDLFLKLVRPGK